jgi:hypothetical protein
LELLAYSSDRFRAAPTETEYCREASTRRVLYVRSAGLAHITPTWAHGATLRSVCISWNWEEEARFGTGQVSCMTFGDVCFSGSAFLS